MCFLPLLVVYMYGARALIRERLDSGHGFAQNERVNVLQILTVSTIL